MRKAPLSKPGLIVASLVISNFLAQLMQTMLNTALPRMMSDIGMSENKAQWLITIFYLIAGIIVPVAGFLIGRFTTRALFFTSVVAFGAGTLIAGFATGFAFILSGRIIQGIGAGLLMPLFQTTVLRVFPRERIGAAMGLVSLVMGLAPALGPTLSGLIVQHHSWRILFYGMAPLVLANFVLAYFSLKNVGEAHEAKLDYRSILYSSLGFPGLLYGLSAAGEQGSSAVLSWAFLIGGVLMIVLFITRQLGLTQPLLDFRLFRYRMFTHSSIIGVLMFIVMVGVELLLPLYAQNVRGLTPRESGLMLLPGALLLGVSGLIAGKLYDRFGVILLVRRAFILITAVTFLLTISLYFEGPYVLLVVMNTLLMAGFGFIMTPITAFTMSSVPKPMITHASPMTISLRSLSSSTGGALLITIMTASADYSTAVFPGNMLHGMQTAFWALTAIAGIGFCFTFYLKESRAPVEVSAPAY
ncbi:DHA2 family efflux MFS transporter permease subunit [Paenibacillus albidus]|uniref:DHA2 family efflux MFS transporter permease subunit n=1 Tax=Paenibacillus albidus TaxID=2041023 RepID=UPI001BE75DAC|nr:DHA2 family efflux MFS transporter permease subunit [Paenibacillus albidus]MBT2288519.1 DHA2 family efflux MFS transporter permease subunit [Paenibacillus albidus]